ncbi:unnamed protein product [Rotaria sp. Silwood1]|nr:unnamed protein product [Rotaria sp. Silwood1]
MQMIQMQTPQHPAIMNNNQLQGNYARRNSQQSMSMIEQNASNIYPMQHGIHYNYMEYHEGMMLPNQW